MGSQKQFNVVLFSFGFKYGTPVDVNYLMDMRFLPNPYWVEELKEKTGKEAEVADYVLLSKQGKATLTHLHSLVDFLVEQNMAAGKTILRIGVGCTGGRHRSVAVTEKIAKHLHAQPVTLSLFHRDIDKDSILQDA